MNKISIDELATRLLHQGCVDSEVDARLAAITIILATEVLGADHQQGDDDDSSASNLPVNQAWDAWSLERVFGL